MKIFRLPLLALISISLVMANGPRKSIQALRISKPPQIDGILDEPLWSELPTATEFYRFQPESGGLAPVRTEMHFAYDDINLYVAARMYEPDPSTILTQLGKRDDDNVVADWLGIWLNPFNDGANELGFMVTAAGVQVDQKFSPNGNDSSWDPVWKSDISLNDDGWSLEMEIPFSQMRFPAKEVQTWGLNMARYRAAVREVYTWTLLDKSQDNFAQQAGLLLGIEHIETPLRLSFTPYVSAAVEHFPFDEPGKSNVSSIYRGGMDLQYGINESFTLDLTLIPDFGQVQSDNEVLNLSPYEVQYSEHRPFFTEGTQLLRKAGLFYSRRVGGRPIRYWQVADEEILAAGEQVQSNPDDTQLINATKITGQTVQGIGLGFFNAVTAPMHAVISDSLGNEREYLTNPLSNYNLLVLSKNLQNGSEFSVVNANVQRFAGSDSSNDFRDANVIGYETRLYTKDSKWRFESGGAYDRVVFPDSTSTGYRYYLELVEDQGSVQYGVGHSVESEFFDPNDLGYIQQPNEVSEFAFIEFRTLNPVWKVNEAEFELSGNYSQLFNPRVYTGLSIQADYHVDFKSYNSIGGGMFWQPREGRNYDEPRVEGRYFTTPKSFNTHIWVSSNYNHPIAASGWIGGSIKTRRGAYWRGGGFDPRWRVNNQLLLQYGLEINNAYSGHGFADFDASDNPVFGRRDQFTVVNSLTSQYIFSRNLESDLRLRYYRSSLKYLEFFDLKEDGNLRPRSFDGNLNTVFNAFTIDAVVTWRFAPGSELNLTWKNVINVDGDDPDISFFDDLVDLPSRDQSNSISVKLLYYVDSWSLRHRH